mgnify:CR=1 FL=1
MLQIEVIGNIGNDAEIKEFSGKKYVSFNVAHSEKRKDANGITVESTTWVFVRGRLVPKAYMDKNNHPQVGLNMYANEVNLCGTKGENNTNNANGGGSTASTPEGKNDDLPF